MNLDTPQFYLLAGAVLFALGLRGVFSPVPVLQRILSVNVMGNGVFLVFITLASRVSGDRPDAVPQAMVLTGIVVAVCATALALALSYRLTCLDRESREERS